jgi:hypothetical protein
MNMLRQMKGGIPIAVTAIVIIAFAFFAIGRLTSAPAVASTPTATRLISTATPNLVLRSPHVLAAFTVSYDQLTNDMFLADCPDCNTVPFTSTGPFVLLVTCDAANVIATSGVRVELRLLNSSGHVLDDVEHNCNGTSQGQATTFSVPEAQPAGSYQLRIIMDVSIPLSLLVLDASQS